MFKLNQAQKISDIFYQPGAVYLDGTKHEITQLKAKSQSLRYCGWVEANVVIADTLTSYAKYNAQNETRMLYANIVSALTGQTPPNRQNRIRWHDIIEQRFIQNSETAIFVNNAQKLKKETLECYLADGKYFREKEKAESDHDFKAYFVVVVPPDTELPPMPGSVVNHITPFHLNDLL